MDLTQLQALGAIVPRNLFKKEIPLKRPVLKPVEEWADPEVPEFTGEIVDDTLTAFIRKRTSADFMEVRGAERKDQMHTSLMRCVCHEDGTPVFETLEQAKQLHEWLFVPLMSAVNEVNEYDAKNSQPRTSSGASSPSSSAARSPKRRRVSRKKKG